PWGRNRPEGVLDASSSGLMRTLSPTTMTSRVMIAARVDPDARSAVAECRLPKVGRNMAGWTRRGHRWGDPELSQPLQASYVDRLRPPENALRKGIEMKDSFGARSTLRVADREFEIFRFDALAKE